MLGARSATKLPLANGEQMPSLSIIVPVYNVEEFLDKCLQSICSQTYKDFEIILINDGSVDGSLEICKKWVKKDSRIRFFSQDNKGLAAVRNLGIREASSDQIMFVDSDDYLELDAIECLITLKQNTAAEIVIGSYINEDVNGNPIPTPRQLPDCVISGKKAYCEVLYDNLLQSYSCMKIFDKVLFNGINFPEGEKLEDYRTLYLLYPRADKVAVTSKIVYHYVIRNGSLTNDQVNWFNVHLTWLEVYKKRYVHGTTSGLLSRRERAFYKIFCIRQLVRVNSWIAWSQLGEERPKEQVEIAKEKTLELLSFISEKKVTQNNISSLMKSTLYKKALVKVFCW